MADYVVAQASVLIVPTLGKGPNSFQAQLERELRKVQKTLTVDVEANTKKFLAEGMAAKKALEADPVNVQFRVVDATKQITEIRHRYQDLVRETKKGLILNMKVVGLSVLPQLSQGLASANASLVQLSQSALLLPGILAGVASSIASVVAGLGGVKDAFKEYGDAQKNAAQEGLKARNSAKNVQNAYRDLGRSIKDAKRNLEDLNAQLRDAPLDEADAIIRLAEARAEAADKSQKSALQQQKDLLAIRRAENELVNVRLRNSRLVEDVASANAKGVAGADSVVEATDRLAKAQDEAATQTTKLSDSLKQLSPNAQQFVQTITGMSDQWQQFRNTVQDRLFDGLAQDVQRFAQTSLPLLEKGFGDIAASLNDNIKTAMETLETPTNQGFLAQIFGDTAAAQKQLSDVFDPFVDSFLRLSTVGTSFLPRMVDGLTDLLTRFDNFIVRAESDGSLNEWIEQGIDDLTAMGNTILNLGSILTSLSEAFTDSGGKTFFEALEGGTARLAEFLRSTEGQDGLKKFFQEARVEFDKWTPFLSTLPDLFGNLADAGQAWADILLPFLSGTSRLLGENQMLVDALLYAFIAWKGILPILKTVKNGFDILNNGIKLLTTFTGGATTSIGKFANAAGNTRTGIEKLGAAIMSPAGLISAVTLAATWVGTNLVKAHDEAASAAQRQKADLDDLKQSLDDVTGAATNASRELVAQNLREGLNEATNQRMGDVLRDLTPEQAQATIDRIVAGDRVGALEAAGGGATTAEVSKTPFWNEQKNSLKEAGIDLEVLTKALNGDPDSLKKFEGWYSNQPVTFLTENGIPIPGGDNLPDVVKRGLQKSGLVRTSPTLKDLQGQLPQDAQLRAAAAGEVNSAVTGLGTGRSNVRTDNERAYGRWRLKQGNPFDALGVLVDPAVGADGGGLVTSSKPAEDSALSDQLRNAGVTFAEDGPGRYIVRIPGDRVPDYFERFASGGLISGPGSGTSDSILARLSNGEFVVNARSTQRHLPLLEQINGGRIPGFAPGGPVKPPVVPDIAPMETGSPVTPPPVKENPLVSGLKSVGSGIKSGAKSVGNFFKSALGIGDPPPGYGETSTAKIVPNSVKYPNMNKPKLTGTPLSKSGFATDAAASDLGKYNFLKDAAESVGGTKPAGPSPVWSKPAAPAPKPNPPKPTSGASSGGAAKPPVKPAPPVTNPGTVSGTSNAKVNPGTTVHGSSGRVKPGPSPAPVMPPPLAAEAPAVGAISQGTGLPPSAVTAAVPPQILQIPGGSQLALEAYGLASQTNIPYGSGGFPDWVYGLGAEWGMLASTYPGHQAGSGQNRGIDWAPDGLSWNTPEGAAAMTRFAKYLASTGMLEQVIYQNPFTGETVGVFNGKLVGPGTDQPGYYRENWASHQNHIHVRTSKRIPSMSELAAMGIDPSVIAAVSGSSPSNMPMAGTPTGVLLPQLGYAPGVSGASVPQPPMQNGMFKLPAPEEMAANYMEYVSEAWMGILENLVQNAGSILTNFVGGFFGLNLSPLTNSINNVFGGFGEGLDALTGERDDPADSMGAIPAVDSILGSLDSLPPEYQAAYEQAAAQNPDQAVAILQQLMQIAGGGGAGNVQYDPSKGAEQWRPLVRQILQKQASKYGITNLKAWEDDIIGQINLESRGNPGAFNGNDTDGRGGTQQVYGLGQFLPATFNAHNVSGGNINDPVAQIYAMIDYLASDKYGVIPGGGVNWKGVGWRNGKGYASGGKIMGAGSGSSDSIIARVSNGEYLVRAPMAQKHLGLLNAINANKLPGFADGMMWPVGQPSPVTPPAPPEPTPPPPVPAAADGANPAPAQQPVANADTAPAEEGDEPDPAQEVLDQVASALGGIGGVGGGGGKGAKPAAGEEATGDPRAALQAAPKNLDHNLPAVSKGIQAAGSAISSAVNTAMSAASMGANAAAPGSGQAMGAASSMINGLVQAGTGAAIGAMNILSSLGVGTVTGGTTAGAYGTPLLPKAQNQQYSGPSVVNNWNGGVHTSNNHEFYQIQQRRELQNAAPYLPRR